MNIKKLAIGLSVGAVMYGMMAASAFAACSNVSTSKGNFTAAEVNPAAPVTGEVDATGCQIGVYFSEDGSVDGAEIHGSNYYGVFADGIDNDITVDVVDSEIHDIGETPFNGSQHGLAVYFYGYQTDGSVSGTISGNNIHHYQKGGIAINGSNASADVTDNEVTGLGPVDFIAQNGIQFGYGAQGEARGNTIDGGHEYTGDNWSSTALLLFDISAKQVKTSKNKFIHNQNNLVVLTKQACPNQYGGVYEDFGLCLY